jgi:acetolactate synthase-1/2/3 large subunit
MKPVILFGSGIQSSVTDKLLQKLVDKYQIPAISSRTALDVMPDNTLYFGYIGSNGDRVANQILYECDTVISLGNRLAYNRGSESFKEFYTNKKVYRIDIDEAEFKYKAAENEIQYRISLEQFFDNAPSEIIATLENVNDDWKSRCIKLFNRYMDVDITEEISKLGAILVNNSDNNFIADAGINETLLTRTYNKFRRQLGDSKLIYPNTFGSLGYAIPGAIGATLGNSKLSIAFIGDQGLGFCVSDLEVIRRENLPISVVVINNKTSGLINQMQLSKYDAAIDTTSEDGYTFPNVEQLTTVYGFKYTESVDEFNRLHSLRDNVLLNFGISKNYKAVPYLPKGRALNDMEPKIKEIV